MTELRQRPVDAAREGHDDHARRLDMSMRGMSARRLVLTILRGLVPSLVLNVVCPVIIYALARPHFPPASIAPLLLASLVPLVGNAVSIVRHRRLDVLGVVMLSGLAMSVIGVLLGGGERLLLIRESFATGAIGLVLLGSLVLPKPLGYYFAKQLLTANDPAKDAEFDTFWHFPSFQRAMWGGTVFWGCLLLGEFALRVAMALTLPVVVVLTVAPLVFNAIIVGGVAVSALWAGRVIRQTGELR